MWRLQLTNSQPGSGRVVARCAVNERPLTTRHFAVWTIKIAMCVAVAVGIQVPAPAQTVVIDREYAIKAAFLYQFSRYVDWPSAAFGGADDAFVIGVYKTDPFDAMLRKIAATKKVGDRSIAAKVVETPEQCRECHILFVSQTVSAEERSQVIQAAQDAAVLVVGESGGFVQQGGAAQFFLVGNKVRFAFHDQIDKRHGLKVSSKLLSLARPAPPLPTAGAVR